MTQIDANLSNARRRRFPAIVVGACCLCVLAFFGAKLIPVSAPKTFEELDSTPTIYPDYVDTTLPPNVAPANFRIEEEGTAYRTTLASANVRAVVSGRDVEIPERVWRRLLDDAKGGSIAVDVYVRQNGAWKKFKSFSADVSTDPIDPYVCYRLIEPGYEFGHRIALAQRSLETFDERLFFDNRATATSPCVNCHSFQDRKTDRFMFHYRRNDSPANGGTVVVDGSKAVKYAARFEELGASCSYPAWRPTGDAIAFSSNHTRQIFHSLSTQKLEVYDCASDLVLFDVVKNELRPIMKTPDDFETFPSWSPDGSSLYYCNAKVKLEKPTSDLEGRVEEAAKHIEDFRYNVMRVSFDESTQTFGDPEVVVDAASQEQSALFPRVSPDGRFLAYTVAKSGTFSIWRPEADLYLKDLRSGEERRWDELNANGADSYHTWSASGRWIVFSSRREDGQYTRLYFAHVDEDGHGTKPFVLPQRTPLHNKRRFKSYNVPEFTVEPIEIDMRTLVDAVQKEPVPTKNR